MKRDITVWISLLMIVVPAIIGLAIGMPRHIKSDDPVELQVLFGFIFLGALRAMVLWFQTLIHGMKHAKEENRVAVVLGHFFLGLIMAYAYYWASRHDAKQAANRSRPMPSGDRAVEPDWRGIDGGLNPDS